MNLRNIPAVVDPSFTSRVVRHRCNTLDRLVRWGLPVYSEAWLQIAADIVMEHQRFIESHEFKLGTSEQWEQLQQQRLTG